MNLQYCAARRSLKVYGDPALKSWDSGGIVAVHSLCKLLSELNDDEIVHSLSLLMYLLSLTLPPVNLSVIVLCTIWYLDLRSHCSSLPSYRNFFGNLGLEVPAISMRSSEEGA